MSIASEAAAAPNELESALYQGIENLSRGQSFTFVQFQRYVLPLDGYIYWVQTATQSVVKGSLHYSIQKEQEEAQTITVNSVVFTAESEVAFLNTIQPGYMWIATVTQPGTDPDGTVEPMQIAFSRRGAFYEQDGLYHYTGFEVYPALKTQIVTSSTGLSAQEPIVSNSLPIWLSQNSFAPVFPSFLVPDNLPPPYIVVHIDPARTDPLQAFPLYTWPGTEESGTGTSPLYQQTSQQLMRDRVKLTLFGFNNQLAIQYFSSLINYSINTDDFGFCNSPAIRDDKYPQVEISAIAQQKTIEIEASYYQSTADAVAQRLILSATIAITTA